MADNYKKIAYALILVSILLLIILGLVKTKYDETSLFLCERFQQDNLDMEGCPAHDTNTSWLIVSSFGIAFLVFGLGLYMLLIHKPGDEALKREFKHVNIEKLDEDEKKIYTFAKEKGGSIYQTDLIKESGFSKVKVSRILDRLESKGVLERKRRGMTNIIVLK